MTASDTPPPPPPPSPFGTAPPPPPPPPVERPSQFGDVTARAPRPKWQEGPRAAVIGGVCAVVAVSVLVVAFGSDDADRGTDISNERSSATYGAGSTIDEPISTESVVTVPAGAPTSTAVEPSTTPFERSDALVGHSDDVLSVDFSDDGNLLVSASKDGTARVWDVKSGRTLRVLFGHTGRVYGATFSHDGTRVATAGADGTVRIWDVASGLDLFGPLLLGESMTSHSDGVTWVEFSPLDDTVVSSGLDGRIVLWDADTGQPLWSNEFGTAELGSASWSPNGDRIVVCDENGRLVVTTGIDDVRSIDRYVQGTFITTCVFSRDGSRIVTASKDNTLKVFDTSTGAEVALMVGHQNWVLSAAFSPAGDVVYSASQDGTARIWDANTGEELWSLGSSQIGAAPINGIDVSPNGAIVAVGDDSGNVVLWYA